jgi:hypothetical protein
MTFGLLFVVALATILAFAIPMSMSDGTEKFKGHEYEVAKAEVNSIGDGPGNFEKFTLKARAEKVYPAPPEQARGWCGLRPEANTDGYYAALISERTFFGITTDSYPRYNCHDYTPQ